MGGDQEELNEKLAEKPATVDGPYLAKGQDLLFKGEKTTNFPDGVPVDALASMLNAAYDQGLIDGQPRAS